MPTPSAFKIFIAYEHFASGIHAREVSERLSAELRSGTAIDRDIWKFEWLCHPLLCESAIAKAAAADLIIIAADGTTEPPDSVKNWLASLFLVQRSGATTLLALLDQPTSPLSDALPLVTYLRAVAKREAVDFIGNAAGLREFCLRDPSRTSPDRPARTSGPWGDIFAHGHDGGIGESMTQAVPS